MYSSEPANYHDMATEDAIFLYNANSSGVLQYSECQAHDVLSLEIAGVASRQIDACVLSSRNAANHT